MSLCENFSNSVVQPLLTDMYQITMAYGYWKVNKHESVAVFDLFFRKNPFNGEFTIFTGLSDCLKFIDDFKFSDSDIKYLKSVLPNHVEDKFYEYLRSLRGSMLTVYAIPEGSVAFPRIPLITVQGPLLMCQLVETTLLTLVNYSSLVTTNAARFRLAAGQDSVLLEFGLRRSQGPDGGLTASKYCYIGGFDGTSNMLAGKIFGIPVKGTIAHSFISSFSIENFIEYKKMHLSNSTKSYPFGKMVGDYLDKIRNLLDNISPHLGELSAFIAYALAFPTNFLVLVDTYDFYKSGLPNYCAVALALNDCGFNPVGVRLDSGDLAYQSVVFRSALKQIADNFNAPWLKKSLIFASNDIDEATLYSLKDQGHEINGFGIGTHLVTCKEQPALGCVYKLVECDEQPCIKLSHDISKVSIPFKKCAFRFFGKDGLMLVDLMQMSDEKHPDALEKLLCRHPFNEKIRANVIPTDVLLLSEKVYDKGKFCIKQPSLNDIRQCCLNSLKAVRSDVKRAINPTPYKVSVSDKLYNKVHRLWLKNAPIGELS